MTKRRTIYAADLFCGAGGTSTGLIDACARLGLDVELLAVNHWETAVETHAANHPEAKHLCATLDGLDPNKATGRRKLDLLVASPECTHHSIARGGKPMSDQSRASAWHVLHWCERLRVENVIVENVPEFRNWGPLGTNGKPLKSRKGETFQAFLAALESLGYRVGMRVINCADFGDATTRKRLFITATRKRHGAQWPAESHVDPRQRGLLTDGLDDWRPAREIIDWTLEGQSINNRKKPLAAKTLARIEEGIRRYSGVPFIVPRYGERGGQRPRTHAIDRPMPTIPGSNQHHLCEPMLLGQHGGATARPVSQPAPTIATSGAVRLIEPFIVTYYGTGGARSTKRPLPAVTTKDRFGLVDGTQLDIRLRMLQPHELAAAMSFPDGYAFAGTKTERVKQIGNAVPVRTASALCEAALGGAA